MKKTLCCFLLTVMLLAVFSGSASAADFSDLAGMETQELLDLRARINAELMSRPEAEDIVLLVGTYTVGTDIKPGIYYVTYADGSWSFGEVNIYPSEAEYKKGGKKARWYSLNSSSREVEQITFNEGEFVEIDDNAVRMNSVGFKAPEEPKGTKVPQGVYTVGIEIPAGRYTAAFGRSPQQKESCLKIFKDRQDYDKGSYMDKFKAWLYSDSEPVNITLSDGNILEITYGDAVMNKVSVLIEMSDLSLRMKRTEDQSL